MNIGQLSEKCGISTKMIRHYEKVGLIPRAPKGSSGYRQYGSADVMRLSFVRRARDAGLSTASISRLLALWQDENRPSREVKVLVQGHLAEIETRIDSLISIREALTHLTKHCKGNERPDCPIIDAFSIQESDERRFARSMPRRRGFA